MFRAPTYVLENGSRWRDAKRYWWLMGLVVPSLPFAAIGLHHLTGWAAFWWLGPIMIFGVVPAVDALMGLDHSNPPEELVPRLEADRYYRWCTYLYLPLHYAGLVAGAWMVARGGLSIVDQLGLALTVGTVTGIGINTAHELGHKKEKVERRLALVALAPSGYGHFAVEHNRGHHLRVSTPEDPASSRLGETFWAFLPRTVWGSLTSAWHLETTRLRGQTKRVVSPDNDVLVGWTMTVLLFGVLGILLGPETLPFLVAQAVFGFCLLEIVNYIEHYGLARQRTESGRYERVRPIHSWNSNNIGSNVLLYHLERHSDHHAHPTRRYQSLRHFEESPQLPTGYAGMMFLALFPPLWRRVMDPRVLSHYGGDPSLANVAPRSNGRYRNDLATSH